MYLKTCFLLVNVIERSNTLYTNKQIEKADTNKQNIRA